MRRFLSLVGPGILIAATGIGAGDLATAGFAGSQIGVACLWAVVLGTLLKFVLTEGLARWQLVTGSTLLDGAVDRFGRAVPCIFLPYLLLWTFFVGAALMSACGVTLHAIWPVFDDPARAKIVFGIGHSLLGLLLVRLGGFALFERIMAVCIAAMFLTVTLTAVQLWPGTWPVLRGLFVPDPVTLRGENLAWTVALMGGIGGTLTVLCYGYWIREKGREGPAEIALTRVDLAVGYLVTMLFGIALVLIGNTVEVGTQGGASLVVDLAQSLEGPVGTFGKWTFLIGAWGAVFSSLLGVWQAVPYLFADFWGRVRGVPQGQTPYRAYLLFIAFVPMLGLWTSFKRIQQIYAVIGAAFLPLLALCLLLMNADRKSLGRHTNRPATALCLVGTLLFFGWILVRNALA